MTYLGKSPLTQTLKLVLVLVGRERVLEFVNFRQVVAVCHDSRVTLLRDRVAIPQKPYQQKPRFEH